MYFSCLGVRDRKKSDEDQHQENKTRPYLSVVLDLLMTRKQHSLGKTVVKPITCTVCKLVVLQWL